MRVFFSAATGGVQMSESVYRQRDPQNTTFKRRHFCPSCHQKRVVEFGEWLCGNVVKAVSHRHVVLSIPKILRRYFLYDRKLLSALSRCAWEAVSEYLQPASSSGQLRPAAVNAIQTFGDFLGYNPHCHMLLADGVFHAGTGRQTDCRVVRAQGAENATGQR